MRRRTVLAATGTAGLASTAGCSGLGSLLSCGPGEDEIADLAAHREAYAEDLKQVSVEGTVESFDEFALLIDDGTGVAQVHAPSGYGYDPDLVSEGDCHWAEGSVAPSGSLADSPAEVSIVEDLPDA